MIRNPPKKPKPAFENVEVNNGKCSSAMELVTEYTANGTLHGINYMGDRERHWLERIFWAVIFFTSFYLCTTLISKSYEKWKDTPIITSADEFSTLVSEIPFPAVTICPDIKANISEFDWLQAQTRLRPVKPGEPSPEPVSDLDQGRVAAMMQVCSRRWVKGLNFNTTYQPRQYAKLLKDLSLQKEQTLSNCVFQGATYPCETFLTEVVTSFGICYTFNAYNSTDIYRKEVDIDLMYKDTYFQKRQKKLFDTNIERLGIGSGMSLYYTTRAEEFEFSCMEGTPGLSIKLHLPEEVPSFNNEYISLQLNEMDMIAIKPQLIKISNGLEGLAPKLRNCYFNHERYLRFYKVYTKANCEMECWTNVTLKTCGCVKFSMPRTSTTKLCGTAEGRCYDVALEQMISQEVVGSGKKRKDLCNCLPTCTSIKYEADISHKYLGPDLIENGYRNPGEDYIFLEITYQEPTFIASTRSELFDQTDFLANCGGLLGLYIGFSILSLVELVYYFTLRLGCNLKTKRDEELEKSNVPKTWPEKLPKNGQPVIQYIY